MGQLDLAWVLGFLSGIGSTGIGDPLRQMDADGVAAWIDNYCRAHPIKAIADAVAEFLGAHPR
jgi:hypothetical protein